MKNYFKSFSLLLLLALTVLSCSKKNSSTDPYSAPFANESVDASKSNLSQAGQDLITQVDSMKDVTGIAVIQSFANCNSKSDPSAVKSASAFNPFSTLEAVASGNNTFPALLNSLKTSTGSPQSFQDFYNMYVGIYNWNANTQSWVKTANNSQLVFNFPKNIGETTNDAQLTITYQGVSGSSIIPGYTGDLPTDFDIAIAVNSSTVAEYSFKASWDASTGIPSSIESFVAVYPFKIGFSWSYSSATVSSKYYFTDGSKNIVQFGGQINGNLSDPTHLDTVTVTQNVIYNANAYFQVFNIKLAGKIDYKALAADMANADTMSVDSTAAKAAVTAINKDASLVLVYADSNQKIAQSEAYLVTEQLFGYTNYYPDIRFIFADGSKGSLDAYFGTGFSGVITDFNTLIADLNAKFGTQMTTTK